ncbi:MAG: DUF2357 domain-containing protein [Kiritimatiellae bacterium]|nr:DUF2357 domain-containing protein [Kiritimatiellia bacterium]
MTTVDAISFKEYLHLQTAQVKNAPIIDEYDDFILKIWELFSLRSAAEDYFTKHKYVAKNRHGALPLPWDEIRRVLESGGPPENIITAIAKRHVQTLEVLAGNLRKVLMRFREMVGIAHVQQLDSHCLRWLTRQPGYSPIEKAGTRQEILGVVRKENYDTLENRVLKDFLRRCFAQSNMYLRRYGSKWPTHMTILNVEKLKNLCIAILSLPECEKVKSLREFPMPNYVLQQDRLYSRVWVEYCKLVRQDDVAEKLWVRRQEVSDDYDNIHNNVARCCSPNAKYATPIWFNELDGKQNILEEPIFECDLLDEPIIEPPIEHEETVVVDLTYPWDGRDIIVIPKNHPNARPFIQNPHRPSREPGKNIQLEEILKTKDADGLSSYFHHLYGLLGGKKWVVLVPDHWDAAWLEKIICARPPALFARSDMFLLWRSVAAALGYQIKQRELSNGESLLVEDGYCHDKYNAITIRFMDDGNGRVVPQRASLRLHGEDAVGGDVRFVVEMNKGDRAVLAKLKRPNSFGWRFGCLCGNDSLLVDGARECLRRMSLSETPYFDELDSLALVVTTRDERVEFSKPLVRHTERWPGGKKFITDEKQPVGTLHSGSRKLLLYLAEGKPREDLKLKEWKVDFDITTKEDAEIMCQVEITPGQGLATACFFASFLERPKLIDIGSATPSDMTKVRIERELKRHFPPTMPYVEASHYAWTGKVHDQVDAFLLNGVPPDAALFYRAQSYWGRVDPIDRFCERKYGENRFFDAETMSPIDKLKRENVFGNNPRNRFPDSRVSDSQYKTLFKRLLTAMQQDRKRYLRLLAWTYQYDNDDFESVRAELFSQYVKRGVCLTEIETSFCANNFSSKDTRTGMLLTKALENICNVILPDQKDLRLAYNLMQFHPTSIQGSETALCERAFNALVSAYNSYRFFRTNLFGSVWIHSAENTKVAGYFIKTMLFILHKRRFDKECLVAPDGWIKSTDGNLLPPGQLSYEIGCKHETMRRSLIEYVNGRGTLEGIPSN